MHNPETHTYVHEALVAVTARVRELGPVHAGRDVRELYSRVITHETHPSYRSLVDRAAFAVLAAAARDAADMLDLTSGDDVA